MSFLSEISDKLAKIEKETTGYCDDLPDMWEKAFGTLTEAGIMAVYSADCIEIYRRINEKLLTVEKGMKRDFERASAHCKSLLAEGAIEDYEIEANMSFHLAENDPDYIEDNDNILGNLTFHGKSALETFSDLGDGVNQNLFRNDPDHPLRNEHYCYLFRCTHGRAGLDFDGISRIDRVWVDINVKYQNSYTIKDDRQTGSAS